MSYRPPQPGQELESIPAFRLLEERLQSIKVGKFALAPKQNVPQTGPLARSDNETGQSMEVQFQSEGDIKRELSSHSFLEQGIDQNRESYCLRIFQTSDGSVSQQYASTDGTQASKNADGSVYFNDGRATSFWIAPAPPGQQTTFVPSKNIPDRGSTFWR